MKIILWFFIVAQVFAQCPKQFVRKEIRELSPTEWDAFAKAVRQMHVKSSTTVSSAYDRMVNIHLLNMNFIHHVPSFFPWHRKYILEFERALQKINPNVTIPYWDWTIDAANPAASIVLSNTYYGGNGSPCVTNGAFGGFQMYYSTRHCLRRAYNLGTSISPFVSLTTIQSIINNSISYDTFRTNIEGAPHSRPHLYIGGDMATMSSPNDPIFWAHHAFIDKIWVQYQKKGSSFFNKYDGTGASLSNLLSPWNVTVQSVMNITNLCYSYKENSLRTAGVGTPTVISIAPTRTSQSTVSIAAVTNLQQNFINLTKTTTAGVTQGPISFQRVVNSTFKMNSTAPSCHVCSVSLDQCHCKTKNASYLLGKQESCGSENEKFQYKNLHSCNDVRDHNKEKEHKQKQ